jgi:hypothetical protein
MPRQSSVTTLLTIVLVLAFSALDVVAHKPVTSRFDYENDVLPLIRDHCSQCHTTDGAAPMSLMTYADAVPWAESIRDEMTAGRMPPWPLDPRSPKVKGALSISGRDIDTIVTWATGGTPQGQPFANARVLPRKASRLGAPDLVLLMPAVHIVAAGVSDEICEFSLATGLTESRWVRATDLVPGTPSVVRDAVISLENGPVLGLWQPGDEAIEAKGGAAFHLPAGAKVHLQIHYKKHFDQERLPVADRSGVGLYFEAMPSVQLQTLTVAGASPTAEGEYFVFRDSMHANAIRIVAVEPMLDAPYDAVTVEAVTPDGKRRPVLLLESPRPQWFRRYWLEKPIEIPKGSDLEVHLRPLLHGSDEPRQARRFALAIGITYVVP